MLEENLDVSTQSVDSAPKRRRTTLLSFYGQIARLESEVEDIINIVTDIETADYLTKVKQSLSELQELENDLKREHKRLEREKLKTEELNSKLSLAMEMLKAQEAEIECQEFEKKEIMRPKPPPNQIPSEELAQVDPSHRHIVKDILKEHDCIVLTDGEMKCIICEENWRKVVTIKTKPRCKFSVHSNSKLKVHEHIYKSNNHKECFLAKEDFDKQDEVLRKLFENDTRKVYIMTCNVIRVVYFILRYDVSALMFEKLVNLLDVLNAMIGNQLHSRQTAAAISLTIDEVYLKMLVNHLISDKCKYFSMEFDELTDKGMLKSLLSKIRINERGHLQSFVFNIFESSGDSEHVFEEFKEDLFEIFTMSGLSREGVMDLLNEKWVGGTADRAYKMGKLGRLFFESLEKYAHFPCDNHETETAWQNTVKQIPALQRSKDLIKDSYAMQSRSVKRSKRLEELSKQWNEKYKKPKTIFEIRFLEHVLDAVDAELIDHEQLLQISKKLSKDTSIKKEKRIDFKELHAGLKDSKKFCELLALKSSLEEALSPYQKWGQLENLCVLDRKWGRLKLKENVQNIGDSLSPKITKQLKKIDFNMKKWKKSGIHCNKITTEADARSYIVEVRKEILEMMQYEKDKIHEENDPEEIYNLADVFDVRLWNVQELLARHEDILKVIHELIERFAERIDDSEVLLIGENLQDLKQGMSQCVRVLLENGVTAFFHNIIAQKTIADQWALMLKHPRLLQNESVINATDRLTTTANAEAGCERANSKYNRSKNKLSSRMKIPMILARNRAGSNGPPFIFLIHNPSSHIGKKITIDWH